MDQSRESAVAPRRLVILGSTGSIGRQALEVLAAVPGCELIGLAAGSSVDLLLEQTALHGVKDVCLRDAKAAAEAAAAFASRRHTSLTPWSAVCSSSRSTLDP